MQKPSVRFLPADWARVATLIAERLASSGRRAWIVGGAARDLALGKAPTDVDMASAARPEEIEALFERTHAVGRAFGTVIVHVEGHEVELTTFRTEAGYSDGRRPDQVEFGASPEQDAQRRDFTCNALYLDPLEDRVLDPTGGLADIEARLLRCVGDPRERFAEDGLRVMRLARFSASLGFAVEQRSLRAARLERAVLAGISPERVASELRRILALEAPALAFETLRTLECLPLLFPRLDSLAGGLEGRLRALRELGAAPGFVAALTLLHDPLPAAQDPSADGSALTELLEGLRSSREERRAALELSECAARLRALLSQPDPTLADRLRLVRNASWPAAVRHVAAWQRALGQPTTALDSLVAWERGLSADERDPKPLLLSADLAQAGVPPGPRWGDLLRAAEEAQWNGRLSTRAQALAWLRDELG